MTNNTLDAGKLRDRVQTLATSAGIRQWDLGAACSDDCSVQVDRGEAKQLKAAQRSSITVRVWNSDGLVGITSTTDLTDSGLARALEGAQQASAFGNPDDVPQFSPMATDPLPQLDRPLMPRQGILPLLKDLRAAEAELLSRHPAIQTVPYNGLAESLSTNLYLNSDGAIRTMERTQASLYLYARAEESGRKPRSSGAIRMALGSSDLDSQGCIDEAVERTVSHLAFSRRNRSYRVCFTPEAFSIGAFSSMFSARAVLDGVSLSTRESLGQTLAVPFLSLEDDGLHPDHISASPFDGEGTPTQRVSLIDSGCLRNFLHSEATARAFGVKPTGHAGLGAKVSVGPDWFVVGTTRGKPAARSWITVGKHLCADEDLSAFMPGSKPPRDRFRSPSMDGW